MSEVADPPIATAIVSGFVEHLGDGVTLEMAPIPGGAFLMGAPAGEPGSDDNERPQHRVNMPPFCMGRYAVTIAQWRAVMGDLPEGILRLDPTFAADERLPVVRGAGATPTPSARSCRRKRAGPIGCRARPSGNMHAGPVPPRRSGAA